MIPVRTSYRTCIDQVLEACAISSHPWLNDRCRHAIDAKIAARGGPDEVTARDRCSEVLLSEFNAYTARTRTKLQGLRSSAKKWWKLSNALQGHSRSSRGTRAQRPFCNHPHQWNDESIRCRNKNRQQHKVSYAGGRSFGRAGLVCSHDYQKSFLCSEMLQ